MGFSRCIELRRFPEWEGGIGVGGRLGRRANVGLGGLHGGRGRPPLHCCIFFALRGADALLFSVALAVGRCGGENSLRRRRWERVGRGSSTAEGLALFAQDPSSLRMTVSDGDEIG
jgi:hypothetical protein